MKPTDRELGLHRAITRRDFVHDVSLGALALGLPLSALGAGLAPPPPGAYYPPTRTGMRGSHPGSFETAHALGREGKAFTDAADLDEQYDLIVEGGSGHRKCTLKF